jgi:hypothetical protein
MCNIEYSHLASQKDKIGPEWITSDSTKCWNIWLTVTVPLPHVKTCIKKSIAFSLFSKEIIIKYLKINNKSE